MSSIQLARAFALPPSAAKGDARNVVVAMADRADEQGYLHLSVRTIAAKAAVSGRTVQRTIRAMQARGMVRVETRRGADGRQTSNRYQLCLPPVQDHTRGDNLSPLNPPDEATRGDTCVTPPLTPVSPKTLVETTTTPPNPPAARGGSGGKAALTTTATATEETAETATAGQGQDAPGTHGQDARATGEATGDGMPDGAGMAPGSGGKAASTATATTGLGEEADRLADYLDRMVTEATGGPPSDAWRRAVVRHMKRPATGRNGRWPLLERITPAAVRRAWGRSRIDRRGLRKRFSLASVLEAVTEMESERRASERQAADSDRRRAALEADHRRREAQQRACLAWFRETLDDEARRDYLRKAEARLRDLRRGADPPAGVVESVAAWDAARDLDWHYDPADEPCLT